MQEILDIERSITWRRTGFLDDGWSADKPGAISQAPLDCALIKQQESSNCHKAHHSIGFDALVEGILLAGLDFCFAVDCLSYLDNKAIGKFIGQGHEAVHKAARRLVVANKIADHRKATD